MTKLLFLHKCHLYIQNEKLHFQGEKTYIQVALRIDEKQTMERESGNLLEIKDNYPKNVITLDEYSGTSNEGIIHFPIRQFLTEFI
jgi:uncharacterized protein